MQNISIYNEKLLSRVFNRKTRKGIVRISYNLDWLPLILLSTGYVAIVFTKHG